MRSGSRHVVTPLTAAVALLIAGLIGSPALWAQRGAAGRSSGFGAGHAAGFASRSSGSFSAPHFSAGYSGYASRGFASAPRMTYAAPSRAFRSGYRGESGHGRDGRRDGFRYRSPYLGYGGYPYYPGSWSLLPSFLDYPDASGYSSGSGVPYADQGGYDAAPPSDQADAGSDQSGYDPTPWAGQSSVTQTMASEPALTVIFNDGRREAIRNYVLTRTDLIVLDQAASGRQQQIPLAQLNLPATEQSAQQAGIDFHPPA